jgi:hypothetical protein
MILAKGIYLELLISGIATYNHCRRSCWKDKDKDTGRHLQHKAVHGTILGCSWMADYFDLVLISSTQLCMHEYMARPWAFDR